jgi:SHS2 domain-containing protein
MTKRRPKFRVVESGASADYVFDAYGDTLNDLFANCALACFNVMTDLDRVVTQREYVIEVKRESIEDLLYGFIAELIYLKDVEKIFLCKFIVDIAGDEKSLKSIAIGERIDYNKHAIKTDVKAVTFHDLQIRKEDHGYATRMILDL